MVERLYLNDARRKEFDASVTRVQNNMLFMDKTAFYPTGGGQPCDTGTVTVEGRTYKIIQVVNEGDDVIHMSDSSIIAHPGAAVHGAIDWERRYAHMRYHTALHIIDGIVAIRHSAPGVITGGQIYADRARMDFDLPTLNKELAEKIVEEANAVIAEGHDVVAKEISRDEALKVPALSRTEPGRELMQKLDRVRVIEIKGFDEQADGGTHVANTKEVGRIKLAAFDNKGAHRKRIEIVLE